ILRLYPNSPYLPWVHFALARAHAIKLLFSMTAGDLYGADVPPLTPAQARSERTAAISEFTRFIAGQPSAPDAVFAWQEAWRLTAGLPPSPIHFGCGCE